MTRPGGDDAADRAGHSWPLPARSPTPLAWVTAPAKLPDTETPQGLRVSGTILLLMGSDSSAPPPSAPFLSAAPPLLRSRAPAPGPVRLECPSRCPSPLDPAQQVATKPSRLSPEERKGGGAGVRGVWPRGAPGEARGSSQCWQWGGRRQQQNGLFLPPCLCFHSVHTEKRLERNIPTCTGGSPWV